MTNENELVLRQCPRCSTVFTVLKRCAMCDITLTEVSPRVLLAKVDQGTADELEETYAYELRRRGFNTEEPVPSAEIIDFAAYRRRKNSIRLAPL